VPTHFILRNFDARHIGKKRAVTRDITRSYKLPAAHALPQHHIHLSGQPKACEQTHVRHEVVAKLVAQTNAL
jgi:hypothetical protein